MAERLRTRAPEWAWAGVLFVATLVAYLPAVSNGFIWDDQYYVTENVHLKSLDGLRQVWLVIGAVPQYYPMVHTSMWIEYRLFGLNPAGYHLDNILLHGFNAILFWRVLLRLRLPGAGLAAAIFALHPVCVESVAWIAERKNVLSTFFYLSASLVYFRYDPPEADADRQRDSALWGIAFALFVLSLLSKTVTFSLPAALLLVYWLKRGRLSVRAVAPLLPFIAVGALFGYQTSWIEQNIVGAVGDAWNLTPLDRVLVAGRASWFYAAKLAWPADLSFNYVRWKIDAGAAWQYLYPVSALLVILLAWLARKRLGRGPLVAVLYFGGTLVPALGFFDVFPLLYSFVADHFQYLASLGPIALFAGSAAALTRKAPKPAVWLCAGLLLLSLGTLTWRQTQVYETPITLWNDVLEKNPSSLLAHNNLGVRYQRIGDLKQAIWHAREVLNYYPEDEMGHFNLANYLYQRGDLRGAEAHYRKQIAVDPDHYQTRENLAYLLTQQGRRRAAAQEFEQARRIDEHVQEMLRQAMTPTPASDATD